MEIGVVADIAALRSGIASMLEHRHSGAVTEIDHPGNWASVADDPIVVFACTSKEDMSIVVDLRSSVPDCGVVALIPDLDPELELAALAAGASAVESWAVEEEALNVLVDLVAARRSVLPSDVADRALQIGLDPTTEMSTQEIGWLSRLATGATIAALAAENDYSEREMYRRLAKLYSRLGARNRLHALLLAVRQGLVSVERNGRPTEPTP